MPTKRHSVASFSNSDGKKLLQALDKIAKKRKISRNQLIALIVRQFITDHA